VVYREKLAETGEHAVAAIGGAYAGSRLVPFTISSYKEWHHNWIVEKGATIARGDYVWKEGYYSKDALKQWEKTLVESKFIAEAQKAVVLKGKGDYTWEKGFLTKEAGKVLPYKQQTFLRTYDTYIDEAGMVRVKLGRLGLPSQPYQAQLGFERFYFEPTARAELQLSEAARIAAAAKTQQYLGKWMTRPHFPEAEYSMSKLYYPKTGIFEQYELFDVSGRSFFESTYFKTGIYAQKPTLFLEYKPVGKFEAFMQKVTNVEYTIPKVFIGKKAMVSPVLEKAYSKTYEFTEKESIFEQGMFSKMFKKGEGDILGKGQFKKIGEAATGKVKEPLIYDWEFYPASMGGVFGTGKIELKLFQEQKILQEQKQELKQEQKLSQEQKQKLKEEQKLSQISLLRLEQVSLTKQLTKQELIQLTEQGQTIGQLTGQKQITGQVTEQITEQITVPKLEVPTETVPDLKLRTDLKIDIKPEPVFGGAFGFGFGLPSMPREEGILFKRPRARPMPRRREFTVEPFAGLYDVHVSELMFGKATHPARTKREKRKFKRRIMESRQLFPTVELARRFRKMKL